MLYGLLPLIPQIAKYQDKLLYWSNWVQLWSLPLLMVGQNVLGESAERREQETHDAVMTELKIAKDDRRELKKLTKELNELLKNNK
jgi:hypothetical protein